MSPHSLSLSLSLSPFFCLPLLQSPPLSLSLILESVHAVSNLSRCLSGCSVYALCATLLPSPLSYALYCTALHCTARLSSHLHLSSFSFSLLCLSLPASLFHYTLLSLLCIAALCSIVWENTVHSWCFCARAECTPATGGRGFRCS